MLVFLSDRYFDTERIRTSYYEWISCRKIFI